jgi:hypothetical protein
MDKDPIQAGDQIEAHLIIDEMAEPEPGEDTVLYEGEYLINVPAGQKATVRYETSVSTRNGNPGS